MSLKPSLREMHHHRIEDLAHEMRPRPAAIACGNCGSILRDNHTQSHHNNYKSRPAASGLGGYVNARGGYVNARGGYVNGGSGQILGGGGGCVGGSSSGQISSGPSGSVGPDPMVGLLMAEINSLRAIIHKLSAAVAAQQRHNQHIDYPPNPNTSHTHFHNNSTSMKAMKRSNIAGSSSQKKQHAKHVQFSEIVHEQEEEQYYRRRNAKEEVPFYPRRNAMEYTSHSP